ncbi:Crp/Fnr family transcriptional regulator [Sphingomonas sp. DT-51]|uniref:Crp/Fnr family transcriptional regulator n=1 Tax=Sphingomonas sp. DT-51 TaxID=3396165 RepID=UPI003F1D8472
MLPAKPTAPNVELMREGERAEALLIVIDGWACRYTMTRDGRRQLPTLLLPGDVGNLDSLMFDRLDYGVRTITHTMVAALPLDRALTLAARYSGIARACTWLGLIENATLSKGALSLGRRSAIERLAHLLCELSVRLNAEKDDKSSYAFPLTQEQIADALGLTSVHVNRMIKLLRTDGVIATVKGKMSIQSVATLRLLGGFTPHYLHMAAENAAPSTRS